MTFTLMKLCLGLYQLIVREPVNIKTSLKRIQREDMSIDKEYGK